MKKVLTLIGSIQPQKRSVSTRVLEAFVKAYKAKHNDDTIETIDISELKDIALTRSIMSGNPTENDQKILVNRKELLEKFKDSDIIVLSSPMWNFGIPGQVKECIDTFAVAGETFRYLDAPNEKGEIVEALTSGKKLVYIEAMGGMNVGPNDIAYLQVKNLFGFIGVEDITYLPIQATNIPGMSEEEKVLSKMDEVVSSL